MARHAADVASIAVLRSLKVALQQFVEDMADGLTQLELEARRPIEWVDTDRTLYWPKQERQASDRVSEARLALQKCELTINVDETKYCYDERKALDKAKRRLRTCEAKVQAVKRWKMTIRKEVEEFLVQVNKMKFYLDSDFQKAAFTLEKMAAALDRYTASANLADDAMGGGRTSSGLGPSEMQTAFEDAIASAENVATVQGNSATADSEPST